MSMLPHFLDTTLFSSKDRHTNIRVHQEETRFDSHASRNAEDCHTFDRLVHTDRLILAVRLPRSTLLS